MSDVSDNEIRACVCIPVAVFVHLFEHGLQVSKSGDHGLAQEKLLAQLALLFKAGRAVQLLHVAQSNARMDEREAARRKQVSPELGDCLPSRQPPPLYKAGEGGGYLQLGDSSDHLDSVGPDLDEILVYGAPLQEQLLQKWQRTQALETHNGRSEGRRLQSLNI